MVDETNNKIEFLSLPYSDRQMIVVTTDKLAEATKSEEKKAFKEISNGIDLE